MSCATPILPSGPLGHVPEMTGHVAEIAGHDPETAGHVGPKYAVVVIEGESYRVHAHCFKDRQGSGRLAALHPQQTQPSRRNGSQHGQYGRQSIGQRRYRGAVQ